MQRTGWLKRLYVTGICLLVAAIPISLRSQQPNVAIREPSTLETRINVMEERMRGETIARELQAKEYERRLDVLNHAHEKAVEDRALTVNKEVFQAYTKDEQAWRDSVERRLTLIEGRGAGISSFGNNALAIGMALVALVGLAYTLLTRRRGPNGKA
jgi:hypothetical protein